ncbi:hypothetical protein CFE70_003861 [Pyrenophora teres f. teres 0-1]|uniref:Uncharacterized protein n=2 Tax=Pyrenophora teres f. teres TaxID=97479 RepID=E3RSU7_PYRTT|nr:hypothetical protein PTT_12035 [Pyrenophora teres f. teres 0-1]KAE8847804.1 hypothetical protein PTNB85_01647 [Pyrenophora teres f. teres]KAE8854039.1 hypothetical protein HRS9122_01031 [Pyrenophora teres f. teres]KAE8867731.1 hypothetical protein PTNB29_01642 [Pyrenophora teres f. teres]KAE8872494.1 hypothetical protein PTNB73_01645 [Pyrenophora teres f. teres]
MRSSTIISAIVAFAPAALAVSSATITSMVPMMTPTAPPVTMAWNDAPTATSDSMPMKSGMSMESGMPMESGMMMSMKTMSSGMMMPTGDAMAAMEGMAGMSGNKTSNAGSLEIGSGMMMMLAVLGML